MLDQETLLSALRTVKDPELNVNVDRPGIGLFDPDPRGSGRRRDDADVAGLPGGPGDPPERRDGPGGRPGVTKANVKLVMSPPWSPEKMSDAARDELGFFFRLVSACRSGRPDDAGTRRKVGALLRSEVIRSFPPRAIRVPAWRGGSSFSRPALLLKGSPRFNNIVPLACLSQS